MSLSSFKKVKFNYEQINMQRTSWKLLILEDETNVTTKKLSSADALQNSQAAKLRYNYIIIT